VNDTSYQKLLVWQKRMDLVEEAYSITNMLLKFEQYALSSQMIRAAISVVSNIAKGWGRNGTQEFIRFLNISFASTCELGTQLLISQKQYPQITYDKAFNELVEVKKMLIALIKSKKNSI
jgi:four helix bundle protein